MNMGDKVIFEPYPKEIGIVTQIQDDRIWVRFSEGADIPINAAYLRVK
jgi:hypothetical protein